MLAELQPPHSDPTADLLRAGSDQLGADIDIQQVRLLLLPPPRSLSSRVNALNKSHGLLMHISADGPFGKPPVSPSEPASSLAAPRCSSFSLCEYVNSPSPESALQIPPHRIQSLTPVSRALTNAALNGQ